MMLGNCQRVLILLGNIPGLTEQLPPSINELLSCETIQSYTNLVQQDNESWWKRVSRDLWNREQILTVRLPSAIENLIETLSLQNKLLRVYDENIFLKIPPTTPSHLFTRLAGHLNGAMYCPMCFRFSQRFSLPTWSSEKSTRPPTCVFCGFHLVPPIVFPDDPIVGNNGLARLLIDFNECDAIVVIGEPMYGLLRSRMFMALKERPLSNLNSLLTPRLWLKPKSTNQLFLDFSQRNDNVLLFSDLESIDELLKPVMMDLVTNNFSQLRSTDTIRIQTAEESYHDQEMLSTNLVSSWKKTHHSVVYEQFREMCDIFHEECSGLNVCFDGAVCERLLDLTWTNRQLEISMSNMTLPIDGYDENGQIKPIWTKQLTTAWHLFRIYMMRFRTAIRRDMRVFSPLFVMWRYYTNKLSDLQGKWLNQEEMKLSIREEIQQDLSSLHWTDEESEMGKILVDSIIDTNIRLYSQMKPFLDRRFGTWSQLDNEQEKMARNVDSLDILVLVCLLLDTQ